MNVPGDKSAVLYLADHETALTHFLYHRHERAEVEQGAIGKLTWELGTFSRQYVQRAYLQFESFNEAVRDKNWGQARTNFKNINLILFFGALTGAWLSWLTGRRTRSPYSFLDIIGWELGGFGIGVTEDIIYGYNQFLIGINPDSSKEDKERAVTNLITRGTRLGDTSIPMWKTLMDSLSAYKDLDPDSRIDREWLKSLREKIDKNYTKEEQEEAESIQNPNNSSKNNRKQEDAYFLKKINSEVAGIANKPYINAFSSVCRLWYEKKGKYKKW